MENVQQQAKNERAEDAGEIGGKVLPYISLINAPDAPDMTRIIDLRRDTTGRLSRMTGFDPGRQ